MTGKQLAALRATLKLTQGDLASLLHLSRRSIQRYEAMTTTPRVVERAVLDVAVSRLTGKFQEDLAFLRGRVAQDGQQTQDGQQQDNQKEEP